MFSQRVNFKKYGYTWHRVIGASRGREKATEPVSLARQDRVKREETEKSRKNKKVKSLCFLLIGRTLKLDWRTGLSKHLQNKYKYNSDHRFRARGQKRDANKMYLAFWKS